MNFVISHRAKSVFVVVVFFYVVVCDARNRVIFSMVAFLATRCGFHFYASSLMIAYELLTRA